MSLEVDGLVEDGNCDFTGVIEKRIVDQLRPVVSMQEHVSAQQENGVSGWVHKRNGLGNVVYRVDDLEVEVKHLDAAVFHLHKVVKEHLVPLLVREDANRVSGVAGVWLQLHKVLSNKGRLQQAFEEERFTLTIIVALIG